MGKKQQVLSVVCFKRYLYLEEISEAAIVTQRKIHSDSVSLKKILKECLDFPGKRNCQLGCFAVISSQGATALDKHLLFLQV